MRDLRGFEISADLECELDGQTIHFRSAGNRCVICLLPDATTLFGMYRILRGKIPLRTLGKSLSKIGHTLEVYVAGNLIARFGRDADGILPRILGYSSTEIELQKFLSLALRRSS